MTSNAFDVQIPATEIQIAEAIHASDSETAYTIRRLAFERDRLRDQRTAQSVCQIFQVADVMPSLYRVVIVSGGIAMWTGRGWISKNGDDNGREIAWEVTWWMPLPVDYGCGRNVAGVKEGT